MSTKLFEIDGADVFIPGSRERKLVLKNINWRLNGGEHCAILGDNGAGKSSLLKLLHGDLWPCSGKIAWYDRLGNREESRIAGRELTAIVSPESQEKLMRSPWPIGVGSVLENYFDDFKRNKIDDSWNLKIRQILRDSGLEDKQDERITKISQGQTRLLLLLGAIKKKPRVLLLDEFTDGLDGKHRELVYDLLELVRDEITMVFTTHRLEKLPKWCEKRFYLHNGEEVKKIARPGLESGHVGTTQAKWSFEPLFALSNVSVYIDRNKILDALNWRVELREHWRISGDNGSGKSTLLRLLAGDEFAAAGGEIKRWNPEKKDWMKSLAEVREHVMLVSDLSQIRNDYPLDAIELVCTGYDNSTGLHREISEVEKERAFSILKDFFPEADIGELAQSDIRRLSTGQSRRLYLARAMLTKPSALLLDEPLNGLDVRSRERFLESLGKFVANNRASIIMVSHYQEDAPNFINRHARLEQGRLQILF